MKLIPAASVFFVTMLILGLSAEDTFQGNPIKRPFDSSHSAAKPSSTQILFHGGPVMNMANSVYVIYYGTFPSTTQPIINDFLAGLSGSPAFGVNSSYNGSTQSPAPVPADYAFVSPGPAPAKNPSTSVYLDNYSQGMQLSNSSVPKIVAHAIAAGLTANQNGVYLVITAPDVKISGFCNSFCA